VQYEKKQISDQLGFKPHAHISGPDLESGTLDRLATPTIQLLKFNSGIGITEKATKPEGITGVVM